MYKFAEVKMLYYLKTWLMKKEISSQAVQNNYNINMDFVSVDRFEDATRNVLKLQKSEHNISTYIKCK